MAVVVECSAADQIAVDHAGSIDVDASAHLQVEPTLGHRRHPPASHAVGPSGNLDAMTNAADRSSLFKEVPGHGDQVGIIPNVLRRPSAREEDPRIPCGVDLVECDIRLDRVPLPFLGDRPSWLDFMKHHLKTSLLRTCHHRLHTRFDQPVKGIHRIERFGGIADDDQDLLHENAPWGWRHFFLQQFRPCCSTFQTFGDLLQKLSQHLIGGAALRYCLVVQDHSVAQRRQIDASDVFETDVVASI